MTLPKFCVRCGQKLARENALDRLMGKKRYYEFSDGLYCEGCALQRVTEARKGIKGEAKPEKH